MRLLSGNEAIARGAYEAGVKVAAAYPEYRFAENKGYGTPDHLEALRAYGPCDLHRRSFRPVRELLCVQEVIELF